MTTKVLNNKSDANMSTNIGQRTHEIKRTIEMLEYPNKDLQARITANETHLCNLLEEAQKSFSEIEKVLSPKKDDEDNSLI